MSVSTVRPADPRVSVVIPARNEARNLEIILPKLPPVYEVILVDGNSVDDTVATAQRIMPDIRVVHQTRKGKGNALACGFEAVTGDVVVMFDADCSADPDEIPRFVQALTDGADVAKGTRYSLGGGSDDITVIRNLGNRGLNVLCNIILGTRYSDLCYGYNAFWADTLPKIGLLSSTLPKPADGGMLWGDGFEIETVLTCRWSAADLRISEVPSHEKLRVHGTSNLNAVTDGIRVLKSIMHERRRAATAKTRAAAVFVGGAAPVSPVDAPTAPILGLGASAEPVRVDAARARALEGDVV
ncbi:MULTISPECIES: glycosyltransferase family 2 protein [unclassified Curtobacterium]|uniref:glycosyltransferase family 2 protein n=1 Tax=unclassified Curtobacterium TaxID=257496 RepID=UPI0009F6A33E|nr:MULTISPECIES: glycosyltransferase family 2 protein [unclassified Curtobacterium]WIA95585.1 glycosyltransferase family 2 protein [Curtobacterium sp. MCBA15_004]WIA98951.1 glycosyltransferase family 2 protein [Curtobacterium sp. MCBA15_012]